MSTADLNSRRLRVLKQIFRVSDVQLGEVERLLFPSLPTPSVIATEAPPTPPQRDWPHAPLHRLADQGTYIVTAATYRKEHHFRAADRLDHLEAELLRLAKEAGWQLEAWAVFSNHYHFVAHASIGCQTLPDWLARLHRQTATHVNDLDDRQGRQVWYNYRDTQLTFETSYLARLNYVHQNAVKHGLVPVASQYPWCSAAWFERTASTAQVRTIYGFKTDQVKLPDDFDPVWG